MGDLGVDTAVERVDDGRYTATLSRDWEIWGPMGGYLASFALRAAGDVSPFDRPASFSCHYLGVASFDAIDISVTTLRQARTAASHRVEVSQDGKPMLEATVWSVGEVEGLAHDVSSVPDVPAADEVPPVAELLTAEELEAGPPFAFWNNVEQKPLRFMRPWPPSEPIEPVWRAWCRFTPTPTFDDPWIDACRSIILVDVQSWPAAHLPHAYLQPPFYAPSLDLYVAFNDPRPQSGWLLTDGHAPNAAHGLMGWTGRLWAEDGALVASGGGQLLCRRVPQR
ncbi:MAG: thioesterase family protein [Acidimicrobiia bacterium]|nr:thioesterase family protein [Acidimicrobiia bacterium]